MATRLAAGTALLLGAGVAAAGALLLDGQAGQVSLGSAGQAWIGSGTASIDAVADDAQLPWTPTRTGKVYPVHAGNALWLRFSLSETDHSERWYLEVPYPAVDRVTLYTRNNAGQWLRHDAGDQLPVAGWPLPHRHPVLPLMLAPNAPQQFFLRVENAHSFAAPLVFTSERQLVRLEQRTALVLGMHFGLAGLAIVMALLGAGWFRDAAFARFALFVALMTLAQAEQTGVAGLHLWPRQAFWNDVSAMALPVAAMGALLWFLSAAVSLRQRLARLHRLVALLGLQCVAAAAAMFVVDSAWRVWVMLPSIILGIAAGAAVVVWSWRRGDRHAGMLLLAMLPVPVGAAFPLARAAGLIASSFWTMHSMQLALSLELPLLLAVLMVRSQERRENNRRLHGLDHTDPATGLINRQVFEQRLRRLIDRSQRLKHQSVVMLVDIVNVEQVRRDWDRRAAEELPLRVAARLLAAAREIDTVARLAEHRFGLLIEGPVATEEASAQGSKIVARCLMPFEGRPPEWVAQVRVAQTQVPSGDDAASLTTRLEALLASVPGDSKRAVFHLR